MTVAIPLSRGRFALVDDEDAERVIAAGPWHTRLAPRTAYARHNHLVDGRFVTVLMHRFITGWEYVDHINGDGLDNRRANLRQATRGQNLANIGLKSNNTSGFKGVRKHSRGRWRATCGPDYLGLFPSPEAAARAYDAAALARYGEFARPNYPQGVTP